MNITKTFTTTFLALLLSVFFVMAIVNISVTPTALEFINNNQVKNFTVTNNAVDMANIVITGGTSVSDGVNTVSFSLSDLDFPLDPNGGQQTITVTSSGNPQDLEFGIYSTSLTVTADDNMGNETIKTVNLKAVSSFCSNGAVGGNLTITKVDIDNLDGDDDEIEILDNVEIEVEVENDGNDEIEDVEIHFGLFDSSGRDVADDFDYEDSDEEQIEVGDIDDGDDEEVTFRFRVPADFDDGNYKLAIKAFSDDLGESVECVDFSDDLQDDFFETINIDRVDNRDESIVVEDIFIDAQATCGDTVSGSFSVFNIGDRDEERVLITMKNNELGLDQEFEITKDFDEGDDETFQFSFTIPDDAVDKFYNIAFRTFFDYDKGFYDEESEDTFLGFVSVLGCEVVPGPSGPVSLSGLVVLASLGSDATAGEELIVNSVITNTETETVNVIVDAKAFQSWADSVTISERILTLGSGESATVKFTFDVNEDASGEQSFLIETTVNGIIEVQEVSVNIEGEPSSTGGGFNFNFGGDNNLIWVIAIINIVLIVLIIVVAVRLSRR